MVVSPNQLTVSYFDANDFLCPNERPTLPTRMLVGLVRYEPRVGKALSSCTFGPL